MYLNILYFNIVVPIVKGRPQLGYDFWRWRWRHIATTHWRWSRPLWRHIATTQSLTTHYPLTTHCDDALSDEALAFDDALRLWGKTYDGTSCDVCFLQLPRGVGCFFGFLDAHGMYENKALNNDVHWLNAARLNTSSNSTTLIYKHDNCIPGNLVKAWWKLLQNCFQHRNCWRPGNSAKHSAANIVEIGLSCVVTICA